METKQLSDLEIKVVIRTSEADMRLLLSIANVIVTSLQDKLGLDVAFIETETSEKTSFEKKLRTFAGIIKL